MTRGSPAQPSASSATPAKGSKVGNDAASPPSVGSAETPDGKVQLSRAALAVPKPKSSGKDTADEDAMGRYNMTVNLIDVIIKEPALVQTLWNKVQEKKRKCTGVAFGDASFAKVYGTLRRLIDGEPEWIVLYISSVSDLGPDELVDITKKDKECLVNIIHYDTQLSGNLRLDSKLTVKDLMWTLLDTMSLRNGRRLRTFKQFILKCEVQWAHVNYKLTFEKSVLSRVKHNSTGATVDVKEYELKDEYSMEGPWNDYAAQLGRPPLAPTRLAAFFPKREGPNCLPDPNKPAALKKLLEECVAKVDEARKKRRLDHEVAEDSKSIAPIVVAKSLNATKEEEQKKKMDELQRKAQDKFQSKKKKSTFMLK